VAAPTDALPTGALPAGRAARAEPTDAVPTRALPEAPRRYVSGASRPSFGY